MMIWIDTLKRASAQRVTAVIPYFGYARQDRKDEGRHPHNRQAGANLLGTAARAPTGVVTVDLQPAQCRVSLIFGRSSERRSGYRQVVPKPQDEQLACSFRRIVGNVKRHRFTQHARRPRSCIIDKRAAAARRADAGTSSGDVDGKNVIMVDDMITTAATMTAAVKDAARIMAPRTFT